ncbi:hypothetical protein D3C85_1499970 [compost metagenome]
MFRDFVQQVKQMGGNRLNGQGLQLEFRVFQQLIDQIDLVFNVALDCEQHLSLIAVCVTEQKAGIPTYRRQGCT